MDLATMLRAARERRDNATRAAREIADGAASAGRSNLTPDEDTRVTHLLAERDAASQQVERLDGLMREERDRAAAEARTTPTGASAYTPRATTSAKHVYQRGDAHGPSWLRDMISASLRSDGEAAGRLRENSRIAAGELQTRALSTTDGAGGDFVPPAYLLQAMAEAARPGRVTANLVRNEVLPAGTDSINLPRIATGTATAEQTTQNTAVQNTDATTATVTSSVATIAGQQVVSVQLIEQSPVNMDEILLRDLLADLAVKADTFVINNNAANKRGLLNVTGINAITYTDASPTVGELYAKLADGVQQVSTGRFLPADSIVMHPRRWAWFLSALDTAGRPIVLPSVNGPQNVVATSNGAVNPTTGLAGSLMGLPVYLDPVIPINLGAGTNEDRILIMRAEDHILYEGTPRAEVFREPGAANLSVLLRVYNYIATAFERFPKSTSVVSGTGLITPTF